MQAKKKLKSLFFILIPGLLTLVKSPCRLSVAKTEKNNASKKKIETTFLFILFLYKLFLHSKNSLSIPGLLTKVKSPCRLSVAKAEKNNASRKNCIF